MPRCRIHTKHACRLLGSCPPATTLLAPPLMVASLPLVHDTLSCATPLPRPAAYVDPKGAPVALPQTNLRLEAVVNVT